ncbi:MAG TPA: hypothetical protein VOA87_09915 [Thermoanaerobaculia bacterium]|nr:hypothetical protein [Thermoanaerobaculia bacterium]
MAFKFKDLMINVLPKGSGQPGGGGGGADCGCTVATTTHFPCTPATTHLPWFCTPATTHAMAGGFGGGGCTPATTGPALLGGCTPATTGAALLGGCEPATTGPGLLAGCGPATTPAQGGAAAVAPSFENLALLKQQLQDTLAKVEAHQKTLEAHAKPKTVAETEALEKQMMAALDEIRAHKEELKKAPKKKPG